MAGAVVQIRGMSPPRLGTLVPCIVVLPMHSHRPFAPLHGPCEPESTAANHLPPIAPFGLHDPDFVVHGASRGAIWGRVYTAGIAVQDGLEGSERGHAGAAAVA